MNHQVSYHVLAAVFSLFVFICCNRCSTLQMGLLMAKSAFAHFWDGVCQAPTSFSEASTEVQVRGCLDAEMWRKQQLGTGTLIFQCETGRKGRYEEHADNLMDPGDVVSSLEKIKSDN